MATPMTVATTDNKTKKNIGLGGKQLAMTPLND
jgi:hypothetical protein